MNIQVKYGLIRLVNTKTDLCEQVANVDLECPIKKGKITITKDVSLPKEIPPVRYHRYSSVSRVVVDRPNTNYRDCVGKLQGLR